MANQIRLLVMLLATSMVSAQSDLQNIIRSGEIILGGLTFFQVAKSDPNPDSKVIPTVCIKNKLTEKIIYRIISKDTLNSSARRELIIPVGGRECFFNIEKGIYIFEIELPNAEIYKKGEANFTDQSTVTIKEK